MSFLETALEHPANELRELLNEFYPEALIVRGRTKAVWRGGDGLNVEVRAKSLTDYVTDETYGAFSFLTEIVGYAKAEAATYLIRRAELTDEQTSTRVARRAATTKRTEVRTEALKERLLAQALLVQRTAPETGSSAYLERKGVTALFGSHRVAPVVLSDGTTVPGLVYSGDGYGPFVQVALRDLGGTVTGYQRLYDGERGKRFVYGTKPKGAFVLLEPHGAALPASVKTLAKALEAGFELAICEGVATGASIALARPQTLVFCALTASNLAPVAAALRERYGFTTRLKNGGQGGRKRKAIDLTVWGDLDESGTGQQAAHGAALKYDCYVRLPSFGKGYGDFNDLHAARGLDAVRRTRKVEPDAKLAFTKELGKQKLSPDKYLAPFALPNLGSALVVRAPQESGKTHRLVELLSGSGLRVLVVTHRESLAKNLAARLRFECYTDYPAHMLRDISRLVICFDSLQKLALTGVVPEYDVLVLDESEQVLEHTTGRHIKRKAANFGVLEHLLKTAPRIICADANAGRLTEGTLKRFSPGRVVTWHRHEHHIAAERRLRVVYDRDDTLDALIGETRPAWYATDSLRHTRDVSAYLDDPNTLTINSETATTDAAAAYLLDPTREAARHHRMVASPSVQTGLSDDSGHWQHVIGTFSGYSSTPQDAMQALIRARRVEQLTVHAARGRGEAVSVQEALDGAAAVDRYEAEGLQQNEYGTANPNYERLSAEVEAQRTRRRANYKHNLVLEAARLGYKIAYDLPRDLSASEVARRDDRREALKAAGLERYVRDRVAAARIDEARAKVLEDAYTLAQEDRYALEQYQCRTFYALLDDVSDADLAETLRADDYKALRDRVLRYETFVEPREVAEARARGELDAGVLRGDARAHLLRHDFGRQLGRVVGLNAETEAEAERWAEHRDRLEAELQALQDERADAHPRRKGEIDRCLKRLERGVAEQQATLGTTYRATDERVRAFVGWCLAHYPALKAAGLVTATPDNLGARPLETVGDALRRCGLSQSCTGKNDADRSYAVTLGSISVMRNYSRPRRTLWANGQQMYNNTSVHRLLPVDAVLASGTTVITDAGDAKDDATPEHPPIDPAGAETYLRVLLEDGRLEALGPRKLDVLRAKLEQNDHEWLYRLARSHEIYELLRLLPTQKAA